MLLSLLSPPRFYGLTHVKKQSIREYYVLESFYQFDQQNARTCVALAEDVPWDYMPRPSHKSNNMFVQTVYLFLTYSYNGCNFE